MTHVQERELRDRYEEKIAELEAIIVQLEALALPAVPLALRVRIDTALRRRLIACRACGGDYTKGGYPFCPECGNGPEGP